MQVKKRNVLEVVLQAAAVLLLFVPGTFLSEYWWWDKDASTAAGKVIYHGVMELRREDPVSFLNVTLGTNTVMLLLGLATLAASAAALVFMIRQLLGRGEAGNRRSVPVLSVLSLALLIAFAAAAAFVVQDFTGAEYRYGVAWLFYILAAVSLAAALVCVIGYRQARRLGVRAEADDLRQTGTAGELLKYKQLLDAGAITEAEFAEMKKKLL